MQASKLPIESALLITPTRQIDERGSLLEVFNEDVFRKNGINNKWVGIEAHVSNKDVIRGIYITDFAKIISCVSGNVFCAIVDMRIGSKTYFQHIGVGLSPDIGVQLFVPPGCGYGFFCHVDSSVLVLQEGIQKERVLKYNDQKIKINWPKPSGADYILSLRDRLAQCN